LHGVVVTEVRDPAVGLVETHTVGLGPLIQSVHIQIICFGWGGKSFTSDDSGNFQCRCN